MILHQSFRRFYFVLAIIFLVIVSTVFSVSAAPRIGKSAPNFKILTIKGEPLSLEALRGNVVILDFFATWCQPCRFSIPHLVGMNKKFGKQGLQIIGMSVDESAERTVSGFVAEYQIAYPVGLTTDSILADYGVRGVPVIYVIDKKGNVAEVYRGYNDEIGRAMEQLVKKLLSEKL